MKGGRKGIGQLFREGLRKTEELKKLGEIEQAKNVKLFQAKNAEAPVVGSGKRRGRPKGSKNKGIKGGNIFDDIRHSFAAVGNTMDTINPVKQSWKALQKVKVS